MRLSTLGVLGLSLCLPISCKCSPHRSPEAEAPKSGSERSAQLVTDGTGWVNPRQRELEPLTDVEGKVYYVSLNGNDENEGTSTESAFATITRCAEVATPGSACLIREGVYRETVRPRHSGTEQEPIVFAPYQAERVIVAGTEPVTDWKAEGDAYVAQVPDLFRSSHNQADQIFVDAQMVHLARWPNVGTQFSRPEKAITTRFISKQRDEKRNMTIGVIEDDDAGDLPSGTLEGAEIFLQPNSGAWSWTLSGKIVEHDGDRITLESRSGSGKDYSHETYDDASRYYAFNKKVLLDSDGEWYLDRSTRKLTLRTPSGDDPSKHSVEMKMRDWCFDLDQRSYIHIKDVELFGCSITTDRRSGGDNVGYDSSGKKVYPWRGKNSVAASKGVVIDGLYARYLNHFTDVSGHFFLQWGQSTGIVLSGRGHTLKNSVLQYSAGNGVALLGHDHRVTNNVITDVAYGGSDTAGVTTSSAAPTTDHEIDHNTIGFTGRSCVLPRGPLQNSDPKQLKARIHHNRLFRCMLQDWDGGGVYGGGDLKFLRVDHNWIHDIEGFIAAGVYFDFGKNAVIDHNVMWNLEWGIHSEGAYKESDDDKPASNMLCYNNTMLVKNTSETPYGPFGFGGGKTENVGTIAYNNIIGMQAPTKGYSPFSKGFSKARRESNLLWNGRLGSATDPRFVSLEEHDFRLTADSPAVDAGTRVPTVVRDGVKVPAFNQVAGKAPDIGAYEHGKEAWRAGSQLPEAKAALSRVSDYAGEPK